MEAFEEGGEISDINCLPFDCLVCICEYLSPRDLCRFGAVCKVNKNASWLASNMNTKFSSSFSMKPLLLAIYGGKSSFLPTLQYKYLMTPKGTIA